MAGDQIRDRVGGNGAAHRAGRTRQPQRLAQRVVGGDAAGGNAQQCLPDLELEVGAGDSQAEWRAVCWALAENARCDVSGSGTILVEARGGPATLELGPDCFAIALATVGETQRTDAALRLPDKAGTEGARMYVPKRFPRPRRVA